MTQEPFTLVNGVPADTLPVTDRGLAYGDGLFETVQLQDGRPLLLDAHLARLQLGCVRLAIPVEPLLDQLRRDLEQLSTHCEPSGFGVLKIIVTRGSGGRGYLASADLVPTRILMFTAKPEYPDRPSQQGVRVRLCELRLGLNPRLAGIKHLNRLEQVLARSEWQDPAIREGLVRDAEDFLVEGTMSNLLWVTEGVLYTPLLDRCGVAGVVRNLLLERASQEGLQVCEGRYRIEDLERADEVMLCNSLIDIWPVVGFGEQAWRIGPVARRLQSLLSKEYRVC